MDVRAIDDQLPQRINVGLIDPLRIGQNLGHMDWNSDLLEQKKVVNFVEAIELLFFRYLFYPKIRIG